MDTGGSITASFPMSPPSVVYCYDKQTLAVLAPPISATRDAIFFRDGDTKLRSVSPAGMMSDVTTVPGGPSVVSFFTVSPDDSRIAVLTEDLSNPTAQLHLYVQDLSGGNNVALLNSSSAQPGGTTLWPMGWHNGYLVLAVVPICTSSGFSVAPGEFRLLDVATGQQVADLTGPCELSAWASPAGVTCANPGATSTRIIDWAGRAVAVGSESGGGLSGLSTSGDKFFVATSDPLSAQYSTWIVRRSSSVSTPVTEHAACLWIDNDHLMGPDAVISATINYMGFPDGAVSRLAQPGACAGRFPGGL